MFQPKIVEVTPTEDYVLIIRFSNNITKRYEVRPLFEKQQRYAKLKDKTFFNSVKIEVGGSGVFWNDEIDISENELYLKGKILL